MGHLSFGGFSSCPINVLHWYSTSHSCHSQYHISLKHRHDLKPIKQCLLNKGIPKATPSSYNTSILPVLKCTDSYPLVWYLRIINMAFLPIYLIVPNPQIPFSISHFTATDSRTICSSFLYVQIHMTSLPSPGRTLTPEQCLYLLDCPSAQGFWDSPHSWPLTFLLTCLPSA